MFKGCQTKRWIRYARLVMMYITGRRKRFWSIYILDPDLMFIYLIGWKVIVFHKSKYLTVRFPFIGVHMLTNLQNHNILLSLYYIWVVGFAKNVIEIVKFSVGQSPVHKWMNGRESPPLMTIEHELDPYNRNSTVYIKVYPLENSRQLSGKSPRR